MRIAPLDASAAGIGALIGNSPALREACELVARYAPARAPVLLVGETGTGKELVARALHYGSPRTGLPFVPVNCGGLPDALVESELFGHARGSFTDASRARSGLVRRAAGGTLFLDEVEALSPRAQVTLLRFLEDGSFRALGEEDERAADVRVVAASNVELAALVEAGRFRSDLMYRLEVLRINLPALRTRPEDLEPLALELLRKAVLAEGGPVRRLTPAALALLRRHSWPGNVRELEHVLLRAHLGAQGADIDAPDIVRCLPMLEGLPAHAGAMDRSDLQRARRLAVQCVERDFVHQLLKEHQGNISAAARACRMERATLSRMVKRSSKR